MIDATEKGKVAVVLLSGGLDSYTTLALAKEMGFTPVALSFDYRQRHRRELEAAKNIVAAEGVLRHVIAQINLREWGGSALTSDNYFVPEGRSPEQMEQGIPQTYVPARNTIFLAFALSLAEAIRSHDIFIGVNALDYSGYPDCRPEYIAAFQALANFATASAVEGELIKIHTPLIHKTKAQIIAEGVRLGLNYQLASSCYQPDHEGRACGKCDSCILRLKGFKELGKHDPGSYQGGVIVG